MEREDFREKCEDCKYCHELHGLVNGEWEYKSVCILFAKVVVEKDGLCEMFTEKWWK